MFFKKKAVQLTFVDKPKSGSNPENEKPHILDHDTVQLIAERSKDVAKYVGLTVIGVYAALKAIDTASQIAVKKTKSADND